MSSNLNFEFTINKENNTVQVSKTFAADLNQIWDAFTKAFILDQWWAPKPWFAKTKTMDFSVGGRRLYAMVGPEGEEHWAIADFTAITPKSNFKYLDAFTDADGNISDEMPRSDWSLDFVDGGETTTVNITIKHKNPEDLEQIITMGFKEGFTMALNNLDEMLLNSTQ